MENPLNIIHNMIEQYKKYTDEKPYVILVRPKTYINIIEYFQ